MKLQKAFYSYSLLFVLLLFLCASCKNDKTHHKIAITQKGTSIYKAGNAVKQQVELYSPYRFELVDTTTGSYENLSLLASGACDFTIIQNSLDYSRCGYSSEILDKNIRTIMPLYMQIVFIIHPDSLKYDKLYDLVKGRRVGMGPETSGTAWLVKKIFHEFGLKDDDYTAVHTPFNENTVNENIDISCSVTSFNNPRIIKMLEQDNLRLFSLDKPSTIEIEGSAVHGISMKNLTIEPCIIPRYTYSDKPETPVLTAGTMGLLLCRSEVPEDVVYEITKTIIEHKPLLLNEDPIFNGIREAFNTNILRFPVHPGANMYYERALPGFLEKYAEVIALIFTVLALLAGAITSISNWQRRRKKNRIDVYYKEILNIDNQISRINTQEEVGQTEQKLLKIRNEAFEKLIHEKLMANESFNIFLKVLENTQQHLAKKASTMQ